MENKRSKRKKVNTKTKSLFNFFTKKSTKIEPSSKTFVPLNADGDDEEEDLVMHRRYTKGPYQIENGEIQVHSTGSNRFNHPELNNVAVRYEDLNGDSGSTQKYPNRLNLMRTIPEQDEIQTISSDFDQFGNSIAMQACKSRLREKLLPPRLKDGNVDSRPHSAEYSYEFTEQYEVEPQRTNDSFGPQGNGGGANSLAEQTLMAAQVLNLIPTERARERNYLAGRLASNSLLGKLQLDRIIPKKEVRIFVGSWNMNGQMPPKQLNDFLLPMGVEYVPEIVTIGTQESCSERFEWEVILQETLGPTHILLHSTSLGTLHLAVFIHRDLIWYCSMPEDASLSVRPGTAFRTKGAVAISFCVFGTSMLFVTSHLTAHQQKVKERVQDIKRIIHALDLPRNLPIKKNKDVTQNFDSVFWCGDLNFRLSEPRDKLLKWIESTEFPLPAHLPHGYMHTDQLTSVLADGAALKGFKEARITFPPTYKFDPGTQRFDTSSKQRAPAYTDRILYKYRRPLSAFRRGSGALTSTHTVPSPVECLAYDSVPSIVTSDHKPVWGLFKNSIQPGIDSIPLAAGLFNREVYLEGMRRRLNNSDMSSSAVCVIQ